MKGSKRSCAVINSRVRVVVERIHHHSRGMVVVGARVHKHSNNKQIVKSR